MVHQSNAWSLLHTIAAMPVTQLLKTCRIPVCWLHSLTTVPVLCGKKSKEKKGIFYCTPKLIICYILLAVGWEDPANFTTEDNDFFNSSTDYG